ncbi:MAG TPA: LuxR C-terminal-related transcriptional regulator [Chloroflexota bacterium]|nr:LuxR C-terminal-related transcriptional regulator [Chloroflexota bacterium]
MLYGRIVRGGLMARKQGLREDASESLARTALSAAELRVRRLALGLTQAQLAGRLGVRANTVARWERGELRPSHPERVVRWLARLERATARPVLANSRPRRPQTWNPRSRQQILPTQLTSFIGRGPELVEVCRLLGSTRLVCLTGSGGIGKTRLAIEAANAFAQDHLDGLWFVELAPIRDRDLVARSVARAMRIEEHADQALIETLADAIGQKQLLLVLDNCEHVLDSCAQLANWLLGRCPELRILATSREPLGIGGETVWRLPSLTLPAAHDRSTLVEVAASESAQLLIERVRMAIPTFALTNGTAAAIARICRRLDGIPLALELAAARVPVLSVEQLADRLDDALRLLTRGSRVAPVRQQTLRATLEWSYGLLSDSEQRLFRRLSVFAGGWTLEAAEVVCATGGIQRGELLDVLARLVEKSLVLAEVRPDGSVRYRMLETLHQLAAELVNDTAEVAQLRDRHLGCFLATAEQAEVGMGGPDQARWLEWFDRDLDNLRTACDWAVMCNNAAAGMRLGVALRFLWVARGPLAEGRSRLEAALALPGAASDPIAHAESLVTIGHITRHMGDWAAAGLYLEHGLALARQIGDAPKLLFDALLHLGWLKLVRGDLESADALFQESLELARGVGSRQVANALGGLGRLRGVQGDSSSAQALLAEAVSRMHALGDRVHRSMYLCFLAEVEAGEGDYAAARRHAREALDDTHGDSNLVRVLDLFVRLAAADHQPELVVRLAAGVSKLRPHVGTGLLANPHLLELARQELGEAKSTTAWAEGLAMTREEIEAFAQSVESADRHPAEQVGHVASLTQRELQVLGLLVEGRSNREIATALVLSVRTAERHIANVYVKIGARGRVAATAYALRHELA